MFSKILDLLIEKCDPIYRIRFITNKSFGMKYKQYDVLGLLGERDIFNREFRELPGTRYKYCKMKRLECVSSSAQQRIFDVLRSGDFEIINQAAQSSPQDSDDYYEYGSDGTSEYDGTSDTDSEDTSDE